MLKFGKIISIVLIFSLVSCSSQRLIIKEMQPAIKDEANKVLKIEMSNGKEYLFFNKEYDNLSYEKLANKILIKKENQIIDEISYEDIIRYQVKNKVENRLAEFSIGVFIGILLPLIIIIQRSEI